MSPPARGWSVLAHLHRAGKGWWARWAEERGQAAQAASHCWQHQRALDPLCPEQGAKCRARWGFGVHRG